MSYSSATPVPFPRGVVARVASDGSELWLGLPIFFRAYDPPNGAAGATVRVKNRDRRIIRWGDTFDNWKQRYIRCVRNFWDEAFDLVPSLSGTGRGASSSAHQIPRRVRARFYPYEVDTRAEAKMTPLCFRAMTRSPDARSGSLDTGYQQSWCAYFGQNISVGLPAGVNARDGYSALLDSNDIQSHDTSGSIGGGRRVTTQQVPANHEMGHHLGLRHRCANVRPSGVASNRGFSPARGNTYVHSTAADDNRGGGDYCDASLSESARNDLMAAGNTLHSWHASLWLDVIQRVRISGVDYSSVGWHARVRR